MNLFKKSKYFYVSYWDTAGLNTFGFGSCVVENKDGNLNIKSVKKQLDEKNKFNCIILNFIRINKQQYNNYLEE